MDKLTIDQAADIATSTLAKGLFIKDSYEQHEYLEGHHKGFKAGAEWKKEQDKELLNLARQLIHAYDFRHPDTNQLLAGYTNEEALLKFNTLYDIFSNA